MKSAKILKYRDLVNRVNNTDHVRTNFPIAVPMRNVLLFIFGMVAERFFYFRGLLAVFVTFCDGAVSRRASDLSNWGDR